MNRIKSYFTLVELLVVIGIIIILAGILLPVTQSALKKADNTKALSQIKALESAIVQYKNDMGYYPRTPDKDPDTSSNNYQTEYVDFIKDFQNYVGDDDKNKHNSRDTKYLDIQSNILGEFKDPWDNDFIVVLDNGDDVYDSEDEGYDGVIDKLYIEGVYDKNDDKVDDYYYSIIIFSLGADGKGGIGTSSSVGATEEKRLENNADNIYSFPNSYNKKDKKHTITK